VNVQSLAHALGGNLTYESASERDWDRLTAMAMGSVKAEHRAARESLLNSLGVSLIALKHARRFDVLRRIVDELAECIEWRLTLKRGDRLRVARLAVSEWQSDNCRTCLGSGHIYDDLGVQRSCGTCGGSRKRRYSDLERAEGLEVEDGAKWAYPMDVAHAQIAFAVGLAVRQAKERLK